MKDEQGPIFINDEENIVRGICSPFHVKKGRLLSSAYDPPKGKDDVSVFRADLIGSDFCKQKSKALENPDKKKFYKGLAVLSAKKIRELKIDVVDSRDYFYGHADIKHGADVIAVAGEPLNPAALLALDERNKKLAQTANYHEDPDLESNNWNGPPLIFKLVESIE